MQIFSLIFLFWTGLSFAQEALDVRFLSTQRTLSNPLALPISVNADGEISLFGQNGTATLSFQPTVQLGMTYANIQYAQPVVLNRFNFYPIQKDLGWIEVRRQRVEGGLGLSSILHSAFTIGIMPYKGAMQTLIRHKSSQTEKKLIFRMPRELAELEKWNEYDLGIFQTYGGISFYAGVSHGFIDIATASIGVQNQFIVEMRKKSEHEVILKISEENLKRRQLILGPFPANATFANFNGKRLTTEFTLDMRDSYHHELFRLALKGRLHELQRSLPERNQKLTWSGHDRRLYAGIPGVAGRSFDSGHYDMEEEGLETRLDFNGSRTLGILTPLRNYHDFVYQTDKGMVVIWSTEMNKASEKAFQKRFLSKGRIIGIRGFDRDLPDDRKFGSVVSQIGVHISREELEKVNALDMAEIEVNLKERCEKEALSCRKEKNLRKIMNKLVSFKKMKWAEFSGPLGLLLLKEPAIIYAVVKTMKYKKEVYFKFLSERYQSMEGSSPIEI